MAKAKTKKKVAAKAKKPAAKAAKPATKKSTKPAAKAAKPASKKSTKPIKAATKPTSAKATPTKPTKAQAKKQPRATSQLEAGAPRPAVQAAQEAGDDAVARSTIHFELGAKLSSVRGDEPQERAAFASAIQAFMQTHLDRGAVANTSTVEVECAEFFWEGDTNNPPVYLRVPDVTNDEISRWFQFLVEEKRAYDARVGAPSGVPA